MDTPMRMLGVLLLSLIALPALGEAPLRLDLGAAVDLGLKGNVSLEATQAGEATARAEVGVARTGYLPEVNLLLQLSRGTGNVVQGSNYGMRALPGVSGPPARRDFDGGTFG